MLPTASKVRAEGTPTGSREAVSPTNFTRASQRPERPLCTSAFVSVSVLCALSMLARTSGA